MTERQFFEKIQSIVRSTGQIGDVFPSMVEWNVPRYLLSRLWPEMLSDSDIHTIPRLCFAASETGWNQRIQNIRSSASKQSDESYTLNLNKAYVMQAETVVLLLRLENEYCLSTIRWPDGQEGLSLIRRDEPHTIFTSSQGKTIHHYRLSGTITVPASNVRRVSERAYSVSGVQVPAREITGLALIAIALAEHHSFQGMEAQREPFSETEKELYRARENKRLQRNDVIRAAELIEIFASSSIADHPIWKQWLSLVALWKI